MSALKLNTPEANKIYHSLLDYLIICDDPKYSKLRLFSKSILSLKDSEDKSILTAKFEQETNSKITYYKSAQ